MPRPRRRHCGQRSPDQRSPDRRDPDRRVAERRDAERRDPDRLDQGERVRNGRILAARRWHVRRGSSHRHRASGWSAVTVAVLLLPVVLAACSDSADLDPGPSAPARIPATASPSPTPTAEAPLITFAPAAEQSATASVAAAFVDYRTARFNALASLDENHPDLAATATGIQLTHDREVIAERREKGYRLQGRPTWSVVEVRGEGTARGEVDACEWDSASWVVDRDGRIVTPVSDRWLPVRTVVVPVDDAYRVSESLTGDFDCQGAT